MRTYVYALVFLASGSLLPAQDSAYVTLEEIRKVKESWERINSAFVALEKMPPSPEKTEAIIGLSAAIELINMAEKSATIMQAAEAPKFKVGDDLADLALSNGKTYPQCKITNLDRGAVTISHPGGIARILISDLTQDWRDQFNYDPSAAADAIAAFEDRQAPVRQAAANRAIQHQESNAAKAFDMAVPADAEAKIRARAEREWKGNFRMQEYEIQQQTEAYLSLLRIRKVGDVPADVIKMAIDRWGDDYNMVLHEIETQEASRRAIKR